MNKADANNNGAAAEEKVSLKNDDPKIQPATSKDRSDDCGGDTNDGQRNQSTTAQQHIPDVFADDIFGFIDSMVKPNKHESNSEAPRAGAIPVNSWRARSSESPQVVKVEQWRQNTNSVRPNHNSTSDPIIRPKSTQPTRFSGAEIRPCPPYELNNMYQKFPHLNAEKVPNPLKATPKPAQNSTKKMPDNKPAKNSHEQRAKTSNSARGLQNMSKLTGSLSTLIGSAKVLANQGRSSSSTNLAGAKRSTDSTQPKNQSEDGKIKGAISKQQQNRSVDRLVNVDESSKSLDDVIDNPVDANRLKSKTCN